ncbi:hypothetical protein [Pseudarthrobacter niigatensis]|uniref:Uncharacterized protein n=1 Tax=Pseudarthrobacter niigatensis TaxID=369935 RepID=A0AAJ1WFP5_9MICC|nr:hypothetical protein [Pseudarthrobacter niigatensis]MDQ0145920.1 hypothetical protein [Pseudarthrobacter niigatensis]MDQ0266352.1 hypothetical protein [Pseudarthrobacter niigatensis]
MTAVLEPQAAGQPIPVQAHDDIQLHLAPMELQEPPASALPEEHAEPMDLEDPAAPFHCGVAMTAGPVPIASLGWAPLELGSSEWSCTCGYTMDSAPAGDPLESVRLASARVESLQWELDAAQEQFENALRTASKRGAEEDALGRAAGLSAVELQDILAGGSGLL